MYMYAVQLLSNRPLQIAVIVLHWRGPSPNHPINDIPNTLIWLRSGQDKFDSMSLQSVQSRVFGIRSRTILHQAYTPAISNKFV